eukprot:snap_masked-scaffold_16-processed-gene-6.51-mRNA-1 protein AED:1.00 eAED:1.00 QI:0/0/0/0/1/1/2/0/68
MDGSLIISVPVTQPLIMSCFFMLLLPMMIPQIKKKPLLSAQIKGIQHVEYRLSTEQETIFFLELIDKL